MEFACARQISQLAAELGHPVSDHPPVSLNLGFTGPTQKAETAALPLKMRPASHQPPRLIIEMSDFNLQSPLGTHGAFAEYFEDKASPVYHFGVQGFFQIVLLHRREHAIHDDDINLMRVDTCRQGFNLARAEKSGWFGRPDTQRGAIADVEANRSRKPDRFLQPGGDAPQATLAQFRQHNHCACAARDAIIILPLENAQSTSASPSSARLSGLVGCTVEIACL